jgi:phosphomevalonate decarboxylase
MKKATARAHPIQGLIKYHGLKDEELRLPFHDSISVCTGPISTITTVEPDEDLKSDLVSVGGNDLKSRELERVEAVLNRVRKKAGKEIFFRVESINDFQTNIGLGASSSAFAALALAAVSSLELDLTPAQISTIARVGAGSASRSVTGGFSRWFAGTDDASSYSERIDEELEMGMLAVVIPAFKQTEDAHKAVTTSPFFQARLDYIQKPLEEMQQAITQRDLKAICELAEMDTMNLHGITMTSVDEMFLWQPETIMVIQMIKGMRQQGKQIYFSIDTGATVYVNFSGVETKTVQGWFESEGFKTLALEVAPGAHLIEDHLF